MQSFPHSRGRVLAVALATAVIGTAAAPAAQAAVSVPSGVPSARKAAERSVQHEDFNGDGVRDTAVAAPYATVDGVRGAGLVTVVYGSGTAKPSEREKQVIHRNTPGVAGDATAHATFGHALTTGDLDGDGFADLVVNGAVTGSPEEGKGILTVIWGSRDGLTGASTLLRSTDQQFGGSGLVNAGDINGDGHQDLVAADGHSLRVLPGPFRRDGSSPGPEQAFDQVHAVDVAVGDLNGDGYADVAVAQEEYDSPWLFPSTWVRFGGPKGLTDTATALRRDISGISLDIGDINGDGFAELVTGDPVDRRNPQDEVVIELGGRISVIPGSARGLLVDQAASYTQDSPGIPGTRGDSGSFGATSDRFGASVTVGRLDADGYADLVVGVPGKDIGAHKDTGTVVLLRGGPRGFNAPDARVIDQNTTGVPGTVEAQDVFGSTTRVVDLSGDGRAELMVSAPGEDDSAGAVWTLRGSAAGPLPHDSVSFKAGEVAPGSGKAMLGRVIAD
ncbi:FG-GAP and VCBS repeat-containing protein [Streptomyces sp. NPDC000594]|uniref:FG-GAP and VCBS repeat-containing protein n=1 Tax=Streptomyces sp. NPDC000594 TaxID=3154261 RepID=UPI00332B3156